MNIIDQEKIGKFIASIRTKKGLKQDELGKRIGVSGKNISKWETGSTFPDVVYQLPLCNELGITLEELHTGCYNNKQRRSQLINRLYKIISLSLIAIIVPLLLFFFVYYITHNNSNKIYELTSVDKDFYVKGLIINDYKKQTIYFNEIRITNKNIKEDDIISLNLYTQDDLIYHSNAIDSFVLQYDKYDKKDLNDFILVITVKHMNNLVEYNIKLSSKIIDYYNNDLTVIKNHIKPNVNKLLIKNGFKKLNNNNYRKTIKNNSNTIIIEYNVKSRSLIFQNRTDDLLIYCNYYYDIGILETSIHNYKSDIHTLIEKYYYNYSDKKIRCQVGECFSAEETIKSIEPYVNLLSSD